MEKKPVILITSDDRKLKAPGGDGGLQLSGIAALNGEQLNDVLNLPRGRRNAALSKHLKVSRGLN